MRIVDVLLSIPFLFVVLIVAVRYGATVLGLSLIIGVLHLAGPGPAGPGRGAHAAGPRLRLRGPRGGIPAARGSSTGTCCPNALGVVIVNATFSVADAILAVATLGFLGFGLQYPTFDWGDMLNNGITYLQDGYWWQVYPVGIAIIAGRDGLQPARRRAPRRARRPAPAPLTRPPRQPPHVRPMPATEPGEPRWPPFCRSLICRRTYS